MTIRDRLVNIMTGGKVATLEQQIEMLKADTPRHFREDNNLPYREDSYRLVNGEDFLTLYENHVPVYACVDAIARNCAKVPMKLYRKDLLDAGKKKHEAEITQRDPDEVARACYHLFMHPNPWQTNFEFRYAMMATAELTGMAYVEKSGVDASRLILPDQLWVLRTDWMRTIPSQDMFVEEYNYQTSTGAYVKYARDEIFEYKYWHPRSEFYGLSPVRPGQNSVIIDLYCIKYAKQFFKNGGHISKYVTIKEKLQEHEFKRMSSEIQTFMGGLENAHKVPLLEGGAELKEIGEDPEKVALVKTRGINLNDICMTFGVPPIILGLPNETHYNNADAQKKVFYEETVIPKNQKLLDAINQTFLEPLGFIMDYDYSDIDVLQPNTEKKANTSSRLVQSRIMTPNEARKEFWDLDPIEGGDKFPDVPGMGFPAGAGIGAPSPSPESQPSEGAEGLPPLPGDNVQAGVTTSLTLNGAQISAALQVIQDFNAGSISKVAAEELLVAVGLPRDKAQAMTSVKLSPVPSPAVGAPVFAKILKSLDEIKDGMTTGSMAGAMPVGTMAGENKPRRRFKYHPSIKKSRVASAEKLTNLIYPVMETAVLNGWKSLQKATIQAVNKVEKDSSIIIKKDYVEQVLGIMDTETLKMTKDLVKASQDQIDKIISHEQSRTGKTIPKSQLADIRKTMADQLRKVVENGMGEASKTIKDKVAKNLTTMLEEKKSPAEIADKINETFEGEDYGHAKTIARTETTKTVSVARNEALQGMGFTKKQWFHSGHENARTAHLEADGEIVPMDSKFSTGLRFPGDPEGDAEDVINCGCTFSEAVDSVLTDEEIAALEAEEA